MYLVRSKFNVTYMHNTAGWCDVADNVRRRMTTYDVWHLTS